MDKSGWTPQPPNPMGNEVADVPQTTLELRVLLKSEQLVARKGCCRRK